MPTISIDLTAPQVVRLQAAWLKQYGVTPTLADIKAMLVNDLKSIVFNAEHRTASDQITVASFDPT